MVIANCSADAFAASSVKSRATLSGVAGALAVAAAAIKS
jgi:hypothetical protein